MEIKFRNKLGEYKHLVMFDLASKTTGVCVWNIEDASPENTEVIKVTGKLDLPQAELYNLIGSFFDRLYERGIEKDTVLVSFEAAPMQAGRFTTAQTLISLGKAHAVLDLYCYEHNIPEYDYIGVSPSTTHAYFRRVKGLSAKDKVEKQDIKDYVVETYGISENITLDESDAVFLAKTLVESKWNKDLDEAVREEKRHMKSLKALNAIERSSNEIERLKGLKVPGFSD